MDMIALANADSKRIPLASNTVQCVVTSPPYWGLRSYNTGDSKHLEIGAEPTPAEYVASIVAVMRECWRVLRDDGVLWLNLGDSYAGSGKGQTSNGCADPKQPKLNGMKLDVNDVPPGLKPKDLVGIPWRVAFALQDDGWYLRSDIIWHKPNPMPESVTDRPTKAHEYVFLLTKNGTKPLVWRARDTKQWSYRPDLSETLIIDGEIVPRWKGFDYYYDAEAIKERYETADVNSASYRKNGKSDSRKKHAIYCAACDGSGDENDGIGEDCHVCLGTGLAYIGNAKTAVKNYGFWKPEGTGRNRRSVWTVATSPYSGAHYATFPPALVEPMILAGSKRGDIVLDPFAGSGTVGQVCRKFGRNFIGLDLSAKYLTDNAMPRAMLTNTAASMATLPMFARD